MSILIGDQTTVREHFGDLARQITAGDHAPLRDLQKLVGGAAARGSAEDVAWLRLGLSQLAGYDLHPGLSEALLALDSVLEGSQIQLDASRARRIRKESRQTLKERVAELLLEESALRPKDLVAATGSDAYQISRALRELKDAKVVELAEPPGPAGAGDGRAAWYQLCTGTYESEIVAPAASGSRPPEQSESSAGRGAPVQAASSI